MSFADQLLKNAEWIFSGIGIAIIGAAYHLFKRKPENSAEKISLSTPITINNNHAFNAPEQSTAGARSEISSGGSVLKSSISILFVDDDVKFQVVNILKRNGWTNTRIIKDVISLEQPEVAAADIYFIDIQGVGLSLGFKDQGLGLVMALRKKYPNKKVVIYSAENADPFHAAWKQANDRISKDADPYEFMEAVERLSA